MQSGKYSRTQRESVKLPEHMGARTASGTSLHSTRAMLSLSAVGAGDALGVVTSTHSNSQSMPSGSSTAATSSRVPAAVISGRMRQSIQALARVGMTFTALPASSMVGVNVAPSRGSTSAATSGSSRRSSAPAARAVCGSLRRTHRSASLTTASINCAVSGETMAGGSYRPSATTAQFIDAVVSDADLCVRLKDPQTARAAGAARRRLDPEVAALVEPLLGATFTPTMLDAGKAVNVIPTRAKACIDCRILPEMTAAGTRELVAAVLDPLGIDWEFEWVDVTTPNASPAPTALSESIARVLCRDVPDAVLAPMCSGSFTDSRWVREYFPDCIAYGFAPYVAESFHAMQGGRDHEPDERIRVEDVTYQALFFERLARDLLA